MNKELVAFDGVSFRRDGRTILKDIRWEIHEGENWVLLGLNGSGKSTLLSMIPAYTYPTRGEVRVFGKTFGKHNWEHIRRRLGFLSSTLDRFSATMSGQVLKQVILTGRKATARIYDQTTPEEEEKADALIQRFELEHIRGTRFGDMSQGERRRTLIARAFMNEPALMILDEPCAALDLRARERLLRVLDAEVSGGRYPFLYVTHQIEEIIPSITHVAILDGGVITCKGEKREVLTEENLSELYEMDVRVEWEGKRPWIMIKE